VQGGAIPESVVQSKLIQQQVMPLSSSDTPVQAQAPEAKGTLRARALGGMLALSVVTIAGLFFAWWHPAQTLWHFVVVTQMIPLFYLALTWWIASRPSEDSLHG
jgi:hypothetical protein